MNYNIYEFIKKLKIKSIYNLFLLVNKLIKIPLTIFFKKYYKK